MKTFKEVLAATKKRRETGADAGSNAFNLDPHHLGALLVALSNDTAIQQIVNTMKTDKKLSQATLALGITVCSGFYYAVLCRKGMPDDGVAAIAAALQRVGGPLTFMEEFSNSVSGLHAEMAILKHMKNNGALSRDDLAGNVFIMCIGKEVCMDCAGYMNSKSIGHCSLLSDGSMGYLEFACGPVSTMGGGQWQHPFSGAMYIGGNDINTYQKQGKSVNQFSR